jgi:hypothetical protein
MITYSKLVNCFPYSYRIGFGRTQKKFINYKTAKFICIFLGLDFRRLETILVNAKIGKLITIFL